MRMLDANGERTTCRRCFPIEVESKADRSFLLKQICGMIRFKKTDGQALAIS